MTVFYRLTTLGFFSCTYSQSQVKSSQSHVTTYCQSASQSRCHPLSGTQDQIVVTVRQLLVCWCVAPSMTRGRVSFTAFVVSSTCHLYLQYIESQSQNCVMTNGQSTCLGVKSHLGSKARFSLLSDSYEFVHTGCPLWREVGSVVHSCCWSSPAQSHLRPMKSSHNFASWVLVQFLWMRLFCVPLTRPHWALSWSAEISLRILWICRLETNCLH
jgi:hypothetical protein